MCMIFHKKFFQCVTAPRPLFLTPQKTRLLRIGIYYTYVVIFHNFSNTFLNRFWLHLGGQDGPKTTQEDSKTAQDGPKVPPKNSVAPITSLPQQ